MHLSIVVNQLSNYHAVPKLYFVNKVTVKISDICQLRLSALAKQVVPITLDMLGMKGEWMCQTRDRAPRGTPNTTSMFWDKKVPWHKQRKSH